MESTCGLKTWFCSLRFVLCCMWPLWRILWKGIKPWDIAAGALIAKEAGALVTDFSGEKAIISIKNEIVAAAPGIFRPFSTSLKEIWRSNFVLLLVQKPVFGSAFLFSVNIVSILVYPVFINDQWLFKFWWERSCFQCKNHAYDASVPPYQKEIILTFWFFTESVTLWNFFYDDAERIHRLLGLTLTSRSNSPSGERIPMAGVPLSLLTST